MLWSRWILRKAVDAHVEGLSPSVELSRFRSQRLAVEGIRAYMSLSLLLPCSRLTICVSDPSESYPTHHSRCPPPGWTQQDRFGLRRSRERLMTNPARNVPVFIVIVNGAFVVISSGGQHRVAGIQLRLALC